jgi:cytochrome c553
MRKIVELLAVAAIVAGTATIALSGPLPATGVFKSPHDINEKGQKDDLQRVCIFCHTPHNAILDPSGVDTFPLWNHTLPADTGWKNYVWATPANNDGTLDTSNPLAGPSRMCLSCHDGVTAFDQHGGADPQAGATFMSGSKNIGNGAAQDLTDDHPIGFSYDAALTARNTATSTELAVKTDTVATSVVASGTAGTYDTVGRTLGKRTIGNLLYNGDIVTCASCHEVHNKDNVPPTVGPSGVQRNYLLWADEKDSLNCLSCHIK